VDTAKSCAFAGRAVISTAQIPDNKLKYFRNGAKEAFLAVSTFVTLRGERNGFSARLDQYYVLELGWRGVC
jgi:hypothetical protein